MCSLFAAHSHEDVDLVILQDDMVTLVDPLHHDNVGILLVTQGKRLVIGQKSRARRGQGVANVKSTIAVNDKVLKRPGWVLRAMKASHDVKSIESALNVLEVRLVRQRDQYPLRVGLRVGLTLVNSKVTS